MYIYINTKLQTDCVSQNMRRWPSLTLYNVFFQETVWCMTEPLQLRWADRFEWFSRVSKKNMFSRHPGTTLKLLYNVYNQRNPWFGVLKKSCVCSPGSSATLCNRLERSRQQRLYVRDLCFQLSLQGGKIGHCDWNKSDYIISHYIISKYITLNYSVLY